MREQIKTWDLGLVTGRDGREREDEAFITIGKYDNADYCEIAVKGANANVIAHKIAAAPDLLAALKKLLRKFENCARLCGNTGDVITTATEEFRAVIAKAEGGS